MFEMRSPGRPTIECGYGPNVVSAASMPSAPTAIADEVRDA